MGEDHTNPSMDEAATHAKRELIAHASEWGAVAVGHWWNKWQTKAGSERLGRVLSELQAQKVISTFTSAQPISALSSESESHLRKPRVDHRELSPLHRIGRAKTLIGRAEKTALRDLNSGLVKDEEGITERLIGAIHHQFNGRVYEGIRWSAMTLTAHKRNAQETTFGADLLGVLQVRLKDYSLGKGFLAQAKYLRQPGYLSPAEFARLKEQCGKMLKHSAASYVFLYESHGFRVVPAMVVAASGNADKLPELKYHSLTQFFEQHFNCLVGDHTLHSANDNTLEELREKVTARDVLLLSGTSTE